MKIINIVNIPNYPNYSIHGKELGLLKVHVSDLLPDDEIEYKVEDTVITLTNNLLIIILTLKKIIFIFTHY